MTRSVLRHDQLALASLTVSRPLDPLLPGVGSLAPLVHHKASLGMLGLEMCTPATLAAASPTASAAAARQLPSRPVSRRLGPRIVRQLLAGLLFARLPDDLLRLCCWLLLGHGVCRLCRMHLGLLPGCRRTGRMQRMPRGHCEHCGRKRRAQQLCRLCSGSLLCSGLLDVPQLPARPAVGSRRRRMLDMPCGLLLDWSGHSVHHLSGGTCSAWRWCVGLRHLRPRLLCPHCRCHRMYGMRCGSLPGIRRRNFLLGYVPYRPVLSSWKRCVYQLRARSLCPSSRQCLVRSLSCGLLRQHCWRRRMPAMCRRLLCVGHGPHNAVLAVRSRTVCRRPVGRGLHHLPSRPLRLLVSIDKLPHMRGRHIQSSRRVIMSHLWSWILCASRRVFCLQRVSRRPLQLCPVHRLLCVRRWMLFQRVECHMHLLPNRVCVRSGIVGVCSLRYRHDRLSRPHIVLALPGRHDCSHRWYDAVYCMWSWSLQQQARLGVVRRLCPWLRQRGYRRHLVSHLSGRPDCCLPRHLDLCVMLGRTLLRSARRYCLLGMPCRAVPK